MEQIVILIKSFTHFLFSLPFALTGATRYTENDIKADWQPPGYVFGIVWPILYLIFGLINLKVEFSSKYSNAFKKLVFEQSFFESLAQALWLWVTSKSNNMPRHRLQYVFGFLIIFYLVYYAFGFRYVTLGKYRTNELKLLYIPYMIWISFAFILSFQQLIKSIYLK